MSTSEGEALATSGVLENAPAGNVAAGAFSDLFSSRAVGNNLARSILLSRHTPPLRRGRIDDRRYVDRYIDCRQYVHVATLNVLPVIEACCPPLLREPLAADEAERLAQAFAVLSEPARIRLLSMIAASEGGEACVCNLTEPMGLSQPTISHHMKVLHDAGLVEREQRGRWAYYRIRTEPFQILRDALSHPALV